LKKPANKQDNMNNVLDQYAHTMKNSGAPALINQAESGKFNIKKT